MMTGVILEDFSFNWGRDLMGGSSPYQIIRYRNPQSDWSAASIMLINKITFIHWRIGRR
jgi:hypothetical protein